MSEPKAWQTYHDKAREHLGKLEPRPGDMSGSTNSPILSTETEALAGVGWAMLALVEVLKPVEPEVLVVSRNGQAVPFEPPDDTLAHAAHLTVLAGVEAEYQRLLPFVGRRVLYLGETEVILTAIAKDPDAGVVRASYVDPRTDLGAMVTSADIDLIRLRVPADEGHCIECLQSPGSYHLSECRKNATQR